jgi:hypothetical protein
MKFIHKQTGVDILSCDDNEILKEILIDEMTTINFKLKKYAEFCVMSDRQNLPLLEPQDFFKKYYNN